MGKNGEKMGEIQPNKCEGRELTKDQLAGCHDDRARLWPGKRHRGLESRGDVAEHGAALRVRQWRPAGPFDELAAPRR